MILFTVSVEKEIRGKGIGKSMMIDAEKWLKMKEFNAAYLISYPRTEDFYKKCGYEELKLGDCLVWFQKKI